jgi:excinuclease ABC subunit B
LRSLRTGEVDVLVGINLLREGLDLPEVSLVAVLDADKEGFLRSQTSLIQTAGRAARHMNGLVILYADVMTDSIKELLAVTKSRREKQIAYNTEHGLTPRTIIRAVQESLGSLLKGKQIAGGVVGESSSDMDVMTVLQELEAEMFAASNSLAYEKAALLRDQIMELKQQAGLTKIEPRAGKPQAYPKSPRRARKAAKI